MLAENVVRTQTERTEEMKKLIILLCIVFVGCEGDGVVNYVVKKHGKPHFRVMPSHESNTKGKLMYPALLAEGVNQPSESFLESVPKRKHF